MRAFFLLLAALAGLMGAAGVGLAAVAAHGAGNPTLATAAQFLLIHAAALPGAAALALWCDGAGLRRTAWLLALAGAGLAAGAMLFSGDLALRALAGARLFAFAAPAGGMAMIAAWLLLGTGGALAAMQARRGLGCHYRHAIKPAASFGTDANLNAN